MDEKELLHYGIKGMRWGFRKSPDEIKRQRRDAKADNDEDEAHEDYKKTIAKKSLKSMSTKEIQEVNNRIQAENQFKELNKTAFDRFKDKAKSVMAEIATNQAKSFINHYADAGREKLQGIIDEKTGLGRLLGLDLVAEKKRKDFELNLDDTRRRWSDKFGKKSDDDKPDAPAGAEKEKRETEAKKKADEAKAKAEKEKRETEAKKKADEAKAKAEAEREKKAEERVTRLAEYAAARAQKKAEIAAAKESVRDAKAAEKSAESAKKYIDTTAYKSAAEAVYRHRLERAAAAREEAEAAKELARRKKKS